MRRALAAALLLLALTHATPFPPAPALRVLSANVGNMDMLDDGPCAEWPARGALCVSADERAVTANVRRHDADVIALFEVIDPERCATTDDPAHVCGPHPGEDVASVRRIVGEGYTILCDGVGGYDCLAVRSAALTVDGCAPNGRCVAATPPQPAACVGQADYSSVFAVDSTWNGRAIRWVVAHPYQAITDEEDVCRDAQLRQALIELPGDGDTVIVGDLNIDPHRLWPFYESPATWFAAVGRGKRFRQLHGGVWWPPPTWNGVLALDHLAVDGLSGGCTVGAALDDGAGRLDHRPLVCLLTDG